MTESSPNAGKAVVRMFAAHPPATFRVQQEPLPKQSDSFPATMAVCDLYYKCLRFFQPCGTCPRSSEDGGISVLARSETDGGEGEEEY